MLDLEYITSLYFNSIDRPLNTDVNNFTIHTTSHNTGVDYIAINSASFTSQINNFNSYNSAFTFKWGASTYTVQLNGFSFSSNADLATKLQALMRTATTSAVLTVTVSTTQTNTLLFSSNDANTMQFLENECSLSLGISKQITTDFVPSVANVTYNTTNPINLGQTKYVDISSRFLTQYRYLPVTGSSNSLNSAILKRIHLDSPALNNHITHKTENLLLIPWKKAQSINGNIDFSLTDDRNRLLDGQNSEFDIEIVLFRKK